MNQQNRIELNSRPAEGQQTPDPLESHESSVPPQAAQTRTTQAHANHLTAQHGIIGCQLFTNSIAGTITSPIAQIPGRVMQTAISIRTLFQPAEKISKLERLSHALQAALAITLLGIAIVRYQQNDDCNDPHTAICKNEVLFDTIYSTMVLLSWGPAQMISHSKNKAESTPQDIPGAGLSPA